MITLYLSYFVGADPARFVGHARLLLGHT